MTRLVLGSASRPGLGGPSPALSRWSSPLHVDEDVSSSRRWGPDAVPSDVVCVLAAAKVSRASDH